MHIKQGLSVADYKKRQLATLTVKLLFLQPVTSQGNQLG